MSNLSGVEILAILAICIGILVALRETVCWYYKINQKIALMKENNALLKKLIKKLDKQESIVNNEDTPN